MNPDYFSQHYDFSTIKNNVTYNGERLRIRDIKRIDGEPMSRKQMIKMCNGFLSELREKYPGIDGLISVSIKYPDRWYSGDVSSFNQEINYFHMSQYEEMDDEKKGEEKIGSEKNFSFELFELFIFAFELFD